MNNLLDDFMKYANSNDDDEDEYFGPPGMTDAESKEKYDRLLATSKKLRRVGLAATLAGAGLRYVTPEIAKSRARLLADQRTKLKERHRAHRNPHGFMVVTPEMGQTNQRVGGFGKGMALTGAILMGAGRAGAGVAHRKRINYLEHALREKSKEQEKTAAPMFGKKRYKPRNTDSQWSRLYYENDLNRYKKFSNAPDFDESAYEKSQQALEKYRPINMKESSKTAKNVLSSLIAADMARRGGIHLLSGNKPAAKRFGVAAGLASIYPAYRGVEGLKRRYHFSKEKNIEADKAERAKDNAAHSAYKKYLDTYNGGEGGWHKTEGTLSDASKHALVNEAKKKNSRIQYNDDYSTNFVSPKGKKSKRRWENAGYLDEDDFDDSDISFRRLSKKTAEQEKTAASSLGKKLYKSDSKLKDAVFGTYKKGPNKGANKFNVAYDKKRILKSWKNDVYKNDEVLDGKIQQRHKDNYDDAFVEAAARPVAIAAGAGAAIYGGKKLLDRYNKRQAEKKEKSYYL